MGRMEKLVALVLLTAATAFGQNPSADTKTFIQVCAQPITDSESAVRHAYCVGYVAGIADSAHDVRLSGPGTYGDVLEATIGWMRSQELSTTPINKLMPIDGMWVGDAVHEALKTLYPRDKIPD